MNSELEEIRKRKLQQLQDQFDRKREVQEEAKQVELQKQMILKKVLAPAARSRLTNINMANPEFAEQLEYLLIRLYQSGQTGEITDGQLKKLLLKIKGSKRETKIIRK